MTDSLGLLLIGTNFASKEWRATDVGKESNLASELRPQHHRRGPTICQTRTSIRGNLELPQGYGLAEADGIQPGVVLTCPSPQDAEIRLVDVLPQWPLILTSTTLGDSFPVLKNHDDFKFNRNAVIADSTNPCCS